MFIFGAVLSDNVLQAAQGVDVFEDKYQMLLYPRLFLGQTVSRQRSTNKDSREFEKNVKILEFLRGSCFMAAPFSLAFCA
jgi:hypothetical protein